MMTNLSTEPGRGDALSNPPPFEEGQRPTWRAVYTIADRGNGRKYWLRIGVAFVNRDNSLNVRLDAIPLNGQLHIRESPPRDLPGREGDERGRDDLREYGNC